MSRGNGTMGDARKIIETACASEMKHGQMIAGDNFSSRRIKEEGRLISVLADGLGSGVKAGVLSTLTATMALKLIEDKMDAVHSAELIISTLPVCAERGIAYSTFTISELSESGYARIIEYDNPPFVLWRQGGMVEVRKSASSFEAKGAGIGKENLVFSSSFPIFPGDYIVIFSDGVSQSGLSPSMSASPWGHENISRFVSDALNRGAAKSASGLANMIIEEALRRDSGRAKDDMTCAVMHFRTAKRLLLVTGPPRDPSSDKWFAEKTARHSGTLAICGGTTANIVARELGRKIEIDLETLCEDVPPASTMDGVSIVTEGGMTLEKVCSMIEADDLRPAHRDDAASRLLRLISEADIIDFLVGTKINEANIEPGAPIEIDIRKNIVRRLSSLLERRLLKETCIEFC